MPGSSTAVVFMGADGLRTSEIGASHGNSGGDIAYQRGMQLQKMMSGLRWVLTLIIGW